MSPETLLLDKSEEKAPVVSRKSSEAIPEDPMSLIEDTTTSRNRPLPWGPGRQADFSEEEVGQEEHGGAVQIIFDEEPAVTKGRTPFRGSLEALNELRSDAMGTDWVEAAAVLKRDVARLSNTSYSRHAAVLLALADALTFTEPVEVSNAENAKPLFRHVLGLLSEPYISEAIEEEFLGELLMAGWNLAPSEEQASESVS